MRYVKAFGQFWYDFIIGDDWKIAVGVVLAVLLALALLMAGVPEGIVTVAGALAVLVFFAIVLLIDTRDVRRR